MNLHVQLGYYFLQFPKTTRFVVSQLPGVGTPPDALPLHWHGAAPVDPLSDSAELGGPSAPGDGGEAGGEGGVGKRYQTNLER